MNKGGRNEGKMDGVAGWTENEGGRAEEWLDGGILKEIENKGGIREKWR